MLSEMYDFPNLWIHAESPYEWWLELLKSVPARSRRALSAAEQELTAAGCPPGLWKDLVRTWANTNPIPNTTLLRYAATCQRLADELDTLVPGIRDTLYLVYAAAGDQLPAVRTKAEDLDTASLLSNRLRALAKEYRRVVRQAKGRKHAGHLDERAALVARVQLHTGQRRVTGPLATILTAASGHRVSADALNMAASRRGQRLRTPKKAMEK
jgi:hypothetical protein